MDLSFLDKTSFKNGIIKINFNELFMFAELKSKDMNKEINLYYKLDKIYNEYIRPLIIENITKDDKIIIEKNIIENNCKFNGIDVETFCNFLEKSDFIVTSQEKNHINYYTISWKYEYFNHYNY